MSAFNNWYNHTISASVTTSSFARTKIQLIFYLKPSLSDHFFKNKTKGYILELKIFIVL